MAVLPAQTLGTWGAGRDGRGNGAGVNWKIQLLSSRQMQIQP